MPLQSPSTSLWFFFYQESATSVAHLFPLIAWGLFWEAIIKDSAEPQRHNFWIRFTREPSGERMWGQATLVTPYRHPCWGLQPRAMKEFSFLGVFACVLGCSAKPLPTHLYANVPSHTLRMFCPQSWTSCTGDGLSCCRNKIWEEDRSACNDLFVDFILVWKRPASGGEIWQGV